MDIRKHAYLYKEKYRDALQVSIAVSVIALICGVLFMIPDVTAAAILGIFVGLWIYVTLGELTLESVPGEVKDFSHVAEAYHWMVDQRPVKAIIAKGMNQRWYVSTNAETIEHRENLDPWDFADEWTPMRIRQGIPESYKGKVIW